MNVTMFTACEHHELYRQLGFVYACFIMRIIACALTLLAMLLLCAGDGSVLAQ